MTTTNNNEVHVVLYQTYVYADFECTPEEEYKSILTIDNPTIKGVFSTREKAMTFLNKSVNEQCQGWGDAKETRERIAHEKDMHWFISSYHIDEPTKDE